MLAFSQATRITAAQALAHRYFEDPASDESESAESAVAEATSESIEKTDKRAEDNVPAVELSIGCPPLVCTCSQQC